jgi:putative DNA methylase
MSGGFSKFSPVAYLILRATLEYPKYGEQLLKDVEEGLNWIFERAKEELEEFYPTHDKNDVAAYIWSWVASCPQCGFKNPLVGQWWLVRKDKKKLFLEPRVEGEQLKLEIKSGDKAPEGTMSKGKGRCLKCGAVIPNEPIRKEMFEKEEEMLLAVVLNNKKGKEYDLPKEEDLRAVERARTVLEEEWDAFVRDDLMPLEEMPDDNRGGIWAKLYLKDWHRLLNPRQKLLFATLVKLIREYVEGLRDGKDEEYAKAVATYLAFVLGKHIDYNSESTNWLRNIEAIGHTLAARGIAISWDHTEVNPFIKSSGTLISVINAIQNSLKYSAGKLKTTKEIKTLNESITRLNGKYDIIVTDPPYFDDVQYAELSEFFYMWEKRALRDFSPPEIERMEDLSVGGNRTREYVERLVRIACKRLNEMLTEEGILVMFFAHSNVDAWDFVVNALKKAGFWITQTWPVHTENPNNVLARGHASLMSSIIITARKRKEDKNGYIEEIQGEMEEHLKKRLQKFWDYGLRGADLTVAAMGASLDILTQYSEIKSYTGELKVKDILKLVQRYVAQFILERFVGDTELDGATSFYIYCKLSDLKQMPFDTANLIAKSLDIDLKVLEKQGLIESVKSGKAKGVKVLSYRERGELGEVRTLIDAVHRVMYAFEKGGLREVESVIADLPYGPSEVWDVLRAFLYLDSSDVERQVAQQVLSSYITPEEGQVSIGDFGRKSQ